MYINKNINPYNSPYGMDKNKEYDFYIGHNGKLSFKGEEKKKVQTQSQVPTQKKIETKPSFSSPKKEKVERASNSTRKGINPFYAPTLGENTKSGRKETTPKGQTPSYFNNINPYRYGDLSQITKKFEKSKDTYSGVELDYNDLLYNAPKGLTFSLQQDPLKYTDYRVINRQKIFENNKNKYIYNSKGGTNLQKPSGSFGIADKNQPEIIKRGGKRRINSVLRIDEPHNGSKLTNKAHLNMDEQYFNSKKYNKLTGRFTDLPNGQYNSGNPKTQVEWNKIVGNHKKDIPGLVDHKQISSKTLKLSSSADNIVKGAKFGGRALGVASVALDAYQVGSVLYKDFAKKDGKIEKETVSELGGMAGGWIGGSLGAKGGAAFGAKIGGLIAGFGSMGTLAPVGALIGGIVGGIIGGIWGANKMDAIGEDIGEDLYDL